jgi:hypothetical protein
MRFFGFLFCIGLLLPIGLLGPEQATIIVTFLGLMIAGILPALSLVVGNTVSASFSSSKLKELDVETTHLMNRLLGTLGAVLVGAGTVFISTYTLPTIQVGSLIPVESIFFGVAEWFVDLPERVVQATAFASVVLCTDRLRLVATAFRRVRELRFELAKLDSVIKMKQIAPTDSEVRSAFRRSEAFGSMVEVPFKSTKGQGKSLEET